VADPRLGRITKPDERDHRFAMSLALPSVPLPTYKYWRPGAVLDQGQFPYCVAYAWTGWELATPIRDALSAVTAPPTLYAECKAIDGLGGGDGTTVRAGAQIMQREGRFANYVWAQNAEDVQAWLLTKGPVVVGTEWTSMMFTPRADGFVSAGGSVEGGHAYLITGFNSVEQKYRCRNSWGAGWGQKGNFWITASEMHFLLFQRDGEACAAVEQVVTP